MKNENGNNLEKNKVSVIIPCYNSEKYIEKSIESAIEQDYEPKEVIVIDDGSTDKSLNIIQSFEPYIKWKHQKNGGAPKARNHGLSVASGEFVKFLDADDLLVEGAIEKQVRHTKESEESTVVYGSEMQIDENGNFEESYRSYRQMKDKEDPLKYILKVNPQTSLPLHKNIFLKAVNGFDESLPRAQEYDLHVRMVIEGIDFKYIPENVSITRFHGGESRVSNEDHLAEDPEYHVEWVRKVEKCIRSSYNGRFSAEAKKFLAKDLWVNGRGVLRNGHPDVAKKSFEYAKELHPKCVVGSRSYRWCVRLLGPILAERIGALFRDQQNYSVLGKGKQR